jgi:hypothetical protein
MPLPEEHDYVAARDFLQLVLSGIHAEKLANDLRSAPLVQYKAKDILRASRLPHLPADNVHVLHDIKKVENKVELSPMLLIRGDATRGQEMLIADGYHRACAVLHLDENIEVPCKIVGL